MEPGRRLLVPALALLCFLLPGPGSCAEEGDFGRSRPAGHRSYDQPTPGKTSVPTAQEPAPGVSGDQERGPRGPLVGIAGCWSRGGPGRHHRPMCAIGELDGAFCELVQCACPAGLCSLKVEVPSCAVRPLRSAEDLAPELLPRTDVTTGVPIQVAASAQTSIPTSQPAVWPRSPHGLPPGPPCTISLSTLQPGHQQLWPYAQCPAAAFPALGPEDAADPVAPRFPEADAQALPSLRFRVQITPEADRCLVMDFGDGSGVQMRTHRATGDVAVTTFHRYRREGVYALQTVLYSESHGAEVRLGPYYVELGPEATSVFLNASSGLRGSMCAFGGSPTDLRSTTVSHCFPSTSSCNVSFALQTHVGGRRAWSSMAVRYRMQPVSVYTNGTVFATDTDITFVAVTKETTPLEFTWFFGEDLPMRTRRRSIQRRLGVPQWYRVVVQASNGMGSVVSEPRRVQVQRRVVASGLVAADSALVNTPMTFQFRVSFGTDVAYRWDFGDGTGGLGNSSASHVYSREGEFTVEVVAFNAVSTVSLRKHLFVVRRPCQPPPVKNMGPGQVQVWRSQPVTLGVTFEAAILCDISQGLSYSWSLTNSAGSPVPLPPAISTHRQTFTVPHYFLEPGNYTALAQVQVRGSPVHSNYCVGVEVRARAPVSVISEGTHLFVPRTPLSTMVLRGSLSYDPDRPGATLRYHWACTPASAPGRPCFTGPSPRSPDAGAPTLSFAADSLSSGYDQFLVTLTVSSHGRNSSEAQVFLSTLPDVALRRVHISWETFRGVPVNWNEELSLRAACEDCGEAALSYSWDLFLVNATGRDREEVPFCRTVGLLGSSGLGSVLKLPESYPRSPRPRRAEPHATPVPFAREPRPWTLGRADLSATGRASTESMVPAPQVPAAGDPVAPEGDPWDEGSLGSPTPHPPDFEAYYSDVQEAVPSRGRQPAAWTSMHLSASGPSASEDGSHGDGDNLVGPFLPTASAWPALLVDWPKSPVSRAVFQGYTVSGVTGQTVTVKPHSLRPGETYVLQAVVASGHSFLGKAQLYVTVNQAPRDVACQVQPHRGLEADTVFSVFCTSGRPDFRYEFGYQIGNASKYTLYRGTDAQHYFALPAGEPVDGYQVLVSTVITDGDGSQTQPCAVAVTVLPRLHGDCCPGEDVYNASLRNLSTLQQMGSDTEVRNYVAVTTRVLSRWAREGGSPSCGQWSRIQDAFISSICRLAPQDQGEATDSVLLLRDLLRFPNKMSLASALLILGCAHTLLAPSRPPAGCAVEAGQVRELILLVSGVLEASDHGHSRSSGRLLEEGAQAIADVLLGCLSSRGEHRVHVSAGQTEVQAQLHRHPQSSVQSLGPVQVRLPADLAGREPSPCYVSQLLLFRRSSFLQGRAPGQVGALLALSLHRCSSRRPLHRPRLRTPVTAEFGEEDGPGDRRNETTFVLLRDRVNVHHFTGLSAASPEALQIRVEFSQPAARAFPVMLLVRFSEKPTPADFLLRQLHLWEGLTAHVSVPAAALEGHTQGYLSLLDADYDRESPNRYLAETVSYVVRFQGVHCLLWDPRREPESLPPQPAASPGKVNCSYNLLAAYSIARRSLNASFESRDVAQFRGRPENLLPSIFIVAITILYALLVTKSKRMDRREKKKAGYIFLQDSAPPSHQLYAVVVDTGFRAPARFTAKVYIILCGEDGLSEPRELCCPEKPLFERNSRHTFVLSTPAALGPLRKVRLWHDSSGACPAWYVSHVMVKELRQGRGHWFFPAECWLAAGRRDGRVERELACLRGGLGFRKLLFSRFTEQLEDLHVWASVHSRPAGRGLLHTPRLSVAFALLCAYACLAALVTTAGHRQLPPSVGPAGVPLRSFWMGFLCTLLASPGAQLLSLLFRLSQRSAPAVLCGGAQAQSAASGHGATQPPPELEACGAELGQWALREKRDCIPGLQAPSRAFEGHVTTPWPRAPRPWLRSAAWAICGMVSVACGVGTVFLGYRFGPAQCGQWLCLLTISVTCCVFVTQPLMVGLVALGFAWKRRDDKSFFTESLQEATKGLGTGLAGLSCTHAPHASCCSRPRGPGVVERVLAERQQARRLRRARPPSTAWLRATRERMRRQTRTRAVLRDTCMSVLMLLLHLLITHATSPRDEHSLNHAIRNTFTRGARSSSGSLSSVDAWWDWSLTTLLDGMYPVGVPGAQPGALGGTCYLIGPAVLKQIKLSPDPSCELSRPLSVLPKDSLPTCHPKVGGSETPSVTNAETHRVAPSDPTTCREHCELSLGRTRPAARAVLTGLRARRWVDHRTRAVSVHFVLYNPPTRLFSHVSLRVALLPAGGLALSPLVKSVTVFHSDPAPRYHLLLPQLAFLALTLTHLCLQLFRLAEEGIPGYWQKPGAWLELPLAGASLAWYAASGHLLSLAGEVTNQLHMGLLQGFVDLSPMASWNQRARWLQGTLSFLLALKCLRLLGSHSAVASCIFATRRSLAGVLAPGLAGVLVLAAHAHLRGIPLLTVAPPSGTFADASHRFPGDTFPGLSKAEGQATAGCRTALLAAVTTLWIGMLRGSLMAFVPKRKSFQSQSLVRLADVMTYVWGAACSSLGLERRQPEEAEPATHHNPSLDEFADLLDELLLKIDSLSARLPVPLPAQPPRDVPQAGARAEGSPSLGASDDQAAGPSGIEEPLRPGLC
uniref:Polycystin-1-like protein 1 n=1 Tax=Myotis myotis TaxID=51298 RepID=A0A7J7V4F4_MYOMY|nr:polycystin 1 like 1, transient receptor potential channel interacting [Myotis myotis]